MGQDDLKRKDIEKLINSFDLDELLEGTNDIQSLLLADLNMSEAEMEKRDTVVSEMCAKGTTEIDKLFMKELRASREEKKKLIIIGQLFGYLPGEGSKGMLCDILNKKNFHEILRLKNLKEKKVVLQELRSLVKDIIARKDLTKEITIGEIPQDFLKVAEQQLKEAFPQLGNGQFRKIEKKSFQEDAKKALFEEVGEFMMENVKKTYEEFDRIGDLVGNLCDWIDTMLGEHFQEIYRKRLVTYMVKELQLAHKRKFGTTGNTEKSDTINKEIKTIFQQNDQATPKSTIKLPDNLCAALATCKQKDEIIRYITRLARNGKAIRISDLVERFGIDPEIVTDEIIANAKKENIHLVANGEKSQTPIEGISKKDPIPETDKPEERQLSREEKKLQLIKEYIQKHKENFNADTCMKVMDKGGYTIVNTKAFKKNFNELYNSLAEKKAFAEELQEVIFPLSEKKNGKNNKIYRTIDLKGLNRILFFEKGIIDGIYNHNEYMKRLRNQK